MLVMMTQRTLRPRCPVCQPAAARRISPPQYRRRKKPRRSHRGPTLLWTLALMLLVALASLNVFSRAVARPPVNSPAASLLGRLSSPRAALLDRDTGAIVAGQDIDTAAPPASLTKIMTVFLAVESLSDLDRTVTIPAEIFPSLRAENAALAGFAPGESARLKDLLYGAMLPSGAECCLALAIQVSGGEEAFVERMNQRAAELGMTNTHFVNCTGLQDPDHYASAGDLARLLDAALENETFRQVFTARRHSMGPSAQHPEGFTVHSSMFTLLDSVSQQTDLLLGGKTGYTSEAGLCLASLMGENGREYILVTTGAPGDRSTEPYHVLDALAVCDRLRGWAAA